MSELKRNWPLVLGGAALILYATLFAGRYDLHVLSQAGIYAIAAIGYQLVFGWLGALSLAQGCFFGLGAYAAALCALRLGLPFPLTLVAGMALPCLLAALIAIPVLRLASHYFALATLGIAQLTLLVATNWTEVTGGANGLYGIPAAKIAGISFAGGLPLTALVWACVLVAAIGSRQLTKGRRGLMVETVRETPVAAAAIGIDGARIRFRFFLASAGLGGLAGALQAHAVGVVSPDVLAFHVLVLLLAMTVIGGRDSALGAVLGALLLTHLPEWFRGFADYYLALYGIALLGAILFLPRGLAGLFKSERSETEDGISDTGRLPEEAPPPLIVHDLSKRFGGIIALDKVSFTLKPGEILGLIGPNGSGKTSLVNVLTGVEKADAGSIRLGETELRDLPTDRIARRGLVRTFQHPQLAATLTVRESVLAAGAGHTDRVLKRTGLDALSGTKAATLPPAAKKRLEIARALAAGARLLALDEPAAGLNEMERAELARLLKSLAADGYGLLVIDHSMDFLLPLADRVICLSEGKRVAGGTPEEVARDPAAVAAYFGEGWE